MTRLPALLVCAAFAASAGPHDSVPQPLADLLNEARAEAEQSAARAQDATGRANAWGKLGMIYHGQRLRELAEDAYERALAEAELPRWRYLRAIVHSERGAIAAAMADFRHVVRAWPDDAVARYRLGVALHLLGELAAATDELEAARRGMPDSALVLAALADLAAAGGDAARAIDLLQRAWRLEPEAGQLAYKLAMAHRRRGDLEAARQWLARQPDNSLAPSIDDPLLLEVARTSRSPRFLEAAANWALARGDQPQAAAALGEAVMLSPNDTALGLRLVALLGALGRADDALAHTRRILATDGESAMAWYLLAWLLRNAETLAARTEAAAAAARALALVEHDGAKDGKPSLEKLRALAAALAMRDGDSALATAHYETLASSHPDDANYRYRLALARLVDGDCSGRLALAEALRLRSDWGEAHLALARADALCGDPQAASQRARALATVKDDADTRITLAFAAYGRGDVEEAARLARADAPHEDAVALLDALDHKARPQALRVFANGAPQWLPEEVHAVQ